MRRKWDFRLVSGDGAEFEDVTVPYTVSYDPKKILETEGGYYALEDGAVLTLTFEGIPQSETYLLLEGIQAEAVSALEFYMESPTAEIFAEEWKRCRTTRNVPFGR